MLLMVRLIDKKCSGPDQSDVVPARNSTGSVPVLSLTTGSIIGRTRKIHSDISPIPPPNFTSSLRRIVATKRRNLSGT